MSRHHRSEKNQYDHIKSSKSKPHCSSKKSIKKRSDCKPKPNCEPCKPKPDCEPCKPKPDCEPCKPKPEYGGFNICSLFGGCLPQGLWCDTLSCIIPCDKVYKLSDKMKVRVNLYCDPFNDIVTVNGVPVFGCLDIPPLNLETIINEASKNSCSISCPVTENLYEKISKNPNLSILTDAINTVGDALINFLTECKTTATFFAPDNEAFEELLERLEITLEELLANPNLEEILLNHILSKVVYTSAFKEGNTKVVARSKECLNVYKNKKNICVSSETSEKGRVIKADILTTNGTIHIIDEVLSL
jgi:uncharacterized surface protein with fasciclin (FAS1) repeats